MQGAVSLGHGGLLGFVFWFWAVLGVGSAMILSCMPMPGALVQHFIVIGI